MKYCDRYEMFNFEYISEQQKPKVKLVKERLTNRINYHNLAQTMFTTLPDDVHKKKQKKTPFSYS